MMNNMSQGVGSFNMTPQNTLMQQNPYGQQMRSPEMFSEQLMAPNQMAPMQDPMQGLQPMSQPAGFGVYGQSLEGYAEGGEAVPRETEIMGQPHMLAYINPEEEMMLRQMGGSGDPGPGGVPSFAYGVGGAGSFQGISDDRRREMRDDRQATERAQQYALLRDNGYTADQAAKQLAAEKLILESFTPDVKVDSDGNTATTSTAGDTALKTSLVPTSRSEDLQTGIPSSGRSGIMGVFDDVKQGVKNFVEDVGMTYAGGIGSFSDLTNQENYDNQYKKLRKAGYSELDASDYLNNTRAGQTAIRDENLKIGKTISDEDRAIMRDERLADEARLASTAVGTGIDTIPIPTGASSGPGTVGVNYGGAQSATGGFTPSSDFDTQTGEIFGGGNTYGSMADGSQLIQTLTPNGYVYEILDPSGSSVTNTFDNYQEAYAYATGTPYTPPAPIAPAPVAPAPVVAPDPIVAPDPVVAQPIVPPAATVDPITPVGGNFLLPGQQNFGPTPSAALNFNPNTYMQTPQNANVVLPEMFQESRPYTFEELLSQYKPAYPVNQ